VVLQNRTVRVSCGFCGRAYAVRDGLRGIAYRMTCRGCGREIVIRPPQGEAKAEAAPVPDQNPFRVAPVTARVPAFGAEASEGADPQARTALARESGTALAFEVAGGPDGELEDLSRALSVFVDDVEPEPGSAEPGARPEGLSSRSRATVSGETTSRFVPGPAADVLGMATKGALGPRIALGLAALVVIGIAGAVLLAPRPRGAAAPRAAAARPTEGAATGAPSAEAPPARPVPPVADAALARGAPGPAEAAAEGPAGPRSPTPAGASESAPVSGEALTQALSSNMAAFDACVAKAVRKEPALELAGRKVTLLLTLAPDGSVSYPTLDDLEFSRTDLGSCFRAAAGQLTGPTFVGEPQQVELSLLIGGTR